MATPQEYPNALEYVKESQTILEATNDASLIATSGELTRKFRVPPKHVDECVRFLDLFTSTKNPAPKAYVQDPLIGPDTEKPRRGIWRKVAVATKAIDKDNSEISQVLRLGFAMGPRWDEARVIQKIEAQGNGTSVPGVSNTQSASTYNLLTVTFPNVAPTSVASFVSALNTSTVNSPTIQGQTMSGTFRVLSSASKEEPDGTSTVIIQLANTQYTLHGYSDWGITTASDTWDLWNVPLELAQGILDAFIAANPKRASTSQRRIEDAKTCDLTLRRKIIVVKTFSSVLISADCRYNSTADYYYGLDDPSGYQIPQANIDAGISYTRTQSKEGDDTWSVTIIATRVKFRDITVGIIEQSAANTVTERKLLGRTTQALPSMAEQAGTVLKLTEEIRDDCSRDDTITQDVGKSQQTKRVEISGSKITTEETNTVQASKLTVPPVVTNGVRTSVENKDSDYPQRFDTKRTDEVGVPVLSKAIELSGAKTITTEEATVQAAKLPDPAPSFGVRTRVDNSNSAEFPGVFDTKKVTDAGKALQTTIKEVSAARTVEIEENTVQIAKLADPAPVAGAKVTVENSASAEYPLAFDTKKTTDTGLPQTTTRVTVAGSSTTTETKKTVQTAPLTVPPATVAGVRVTVENSDSDYPQRTDTVRVDEVGVPLTSKLTEIQGGRTVVEEQKTVQAIPLPDPSPVAGVAVTVENSQSTQFPGVVDTKRTTDTGIPLTTNAVEITAAKIVTDERKTVQLAPLALPSAEIPGVRVTVENQPSERYSQAWDTSKRQDTGKPLTSLSTEIAGARTVSQEQKTVQTAPLPAPAVTPGVRVTVENSDNAEYPQRTDTKKVIDTGNPLATVTTEISGARTVIEERRTVQPSPLPSPAPFPGVRVTVENADSAEYPLVTDTSKRTDTGNPLLTTVVSVNGARTVTETERTVQVAPLPSPPSVVPGVKITIENRQSPEYPLVQDTKETLDVGIPQTRRSVTATTEKTVIEEENTIQSAPLPDPSATKGQEKEVTNEDSDYPGRKTTKQRLVTFFKRVAQAVGGSVLEDIFEETDENDDVDTSGLTAGAKGTITEHESSPSDAGLFRNRKRRRVAKLYEVPDMAIGGNAFYKVYLSARRNKPTVNFKQLDGEEREAGASINSTGLLDSEEHRRVPTRQEIPTTVVEQDEFSETTENRVWNGDAFPTAVAATGSQAVGELAINGFAKFDYRVLTTGPKSGVIGSTSEWIEWGPGQWEGYMHTYFVDWFGYASTQSAAQARADDAWTYGLRSVLRGVQYFRWKHTNTILYCPTEAAAIAFISNLAAPGDLISTGGNHSRVAPGVWRAHRIISEKIIITNIFV